MSHFTSGLIGAAVATVAFGAAQFAVGNGMAGAQPTAAETSQQINDVNRSGKADRLATELFDAAPTKTVAVRVAELPGTSLLVRIPAAIQRKDAASSGKSGLKPAAAALQTTPVRRQVACEPVVSVLTDVAKLLQPGRCVT